MYSLAYVILPFAEGSPAETIRASLARFQRGGTGDVPDEWLRFHDETAEVEALHRAHFTFTLDAGLRVDGGDSWNLDIAAICREMEQRGLQRWSVRFAELEPDLVRFATRFLTPFAQHAATGGLGHWLNPVGRWDWWELGGHFDGVMTGQPRRAARARSAISSGPSRGRAILERLEDALGDALGQPAPEEIDITADANVELVSRLRDDFAQAEASVLPGAVILPPGSGDDELRWISNWPAVGPADALALLDLPDAAPWRDVVSAVYDAFANHWAAGVAFHH